MHEPAEFFAPTYAQARARFLAAAEGLDPQACIEPGHGREGEALAIDIARIGPHHADALLVISSGCHGVEGHAGSGLQTSLLRDQPFLTRAEELGVELLFIHALNPWGFSFGRRVTQEGVDLNRNFVDFRHPLPRNAGYDQLADRLLPAAWPPSAENEHALAAYAADHGQRALQQVVSGGQYHHPEGLFFGGHAPTWSHTTVRMILRQHVSRCRRLGWIDVHTGLGEFGVGERIFAGPDDAATRQRAKALWGPDVRFTEDGDSSSAPLIGHLWHAAREECIQAAYTGIALEFGTVPAPMVLQALRFDHWAARHEPPSQALREQARAQMLKAFYPETAAWQQAVLRQGREAALLAVQGLAG